MTYAPASEGDLLRRRPMSLRLFFRRYIMGQPTELLLTKEQLAASVNWDEGQTDCNERRIRIIADELQATIDGLREQFAKVASLIALFALMIAFGLNGDNKATIVRAVCLVAMLAIWVQSPRGKVFRFRRRADSGVRVGHIKSQLDEYHYLYVWLCNREQTLHAAEVLLVVVTAAGMCALGYIAIAV